MKKDWLLVGTTLFSGYLLAAGCSLINAPSEIKTSNEVGGSGGGSSSLASSSSSSSSSGTAGAGGNGMVCQPSSQMPCYNGTPGTAGIGTCQMGMVTCLTDGTGYGPCAGEITDAAMDDCKTPLFDENCDGVENDGCPGEHLAIVAAALTGYADEVHTYLMATGKFETITIFDASMATPTLADLQPNQATLVFSDKMFVDPVALGDVLADYYDGGGRVVLALFSTVGPDTQIQGKFGDVTNGYMITDPAGTLSTSMDDALGSIAEPQSPLMRDVTTFSYPSSIKSQGGAINSGVVVANWSSNLPLIIRGTALGRNRVDVNFFPPQTQMGTMAWMGDGVAILRNAVLF